MEYTDSYDNFPLPHVTEDPVVREKCPEISYNDQEPVKLRYFSARLERDKNIPENIDIDIHAFLFDESGDLKDCVYYREPKIVGGGVSLNDQNSSISIDLLLLPEICKYIIFTLAVYKGGTLADIQKSEFIISSYIPIESGNIYDTDIPPSINRNKEKYLEIDLCRGNLYLKNQENTTAMILSMLVEHKNSWYIKTINHGIPAYTPNAIAGIAQVIIQKFILSLETITCDPKVINIERFLIKILKNEPGDIDETNEDSKDFLKLKFPKDNKEEENYVFHETIDSKMLQNLIADKNELIAEITKLKNFVPKISANDDKIALLDKKVDKILNFSNEIACNIKTVADSTNRLIKTFETKLEVIHNELASQIVKLERMISNLNEKVNELKKKVSTDSNKLEDLRKVCKIMENLVLALYTTNDYFAQNISEIQHHLIRQGRTADIKPCNMDGLGSDTIVNFFKEDIAKEQETGTKSYLQSYMKNLENLEVASQKFSYSLRSISNSTSPDGPKNLSFIERKVLAMAGSPKTMSLLHNLENTLEKLGLKSLGIDLKE